MGAASEMQGKTGAPHPALLHEDCELHSARATSDDAVLVLVAASHRYRSNHGQQRHQRPEHNTRLSSAPPHHWSTLRNKNQSLKQDRSGMLHGTVDVDDVVAGIVTAVGDANSSSIRTFGLPTCCDRTVATLWQLW
jgi:hypothetical protein